MNKFILTLSVLTALSAPAWAGPGHDHGPSDGGNSGPLAEIVLSNAMIKNLGVQTVSAVLQDVAKTVDLVANVDYLPENQAIISARAEGSVTRIMVRMGERVKKGDVVLELQPRLVGNPPVTLTAPIDGYVIEQNAVMGQSVTPDQTLMKIADISEVLVRGQAYEDIASSNLAVGRPVMVTTSAFPHDVFKGEIQRVDASFRPGLRIREAWAVVDNADGKLLANMQAQMAVVIGEAAPSVIVPQRAVLGDTGNYFVYVQDGDHFYRRDVMMGRKYGSMREIVEGLNEGENVVTVGNYQLQFVTESADHDHSEPAVEDDHDHGDHDDHSHDETDTHDDHDDHGHAH